MSIFGWQWALAHARGVSLHDANDSVDSIRRDASARGSAARSRVRRSDVRVGAEVYVEKRALRAFEQNLFSALNRVVQIDNRVHYERPQLCAGGKIASIHSIIVDRLGAERAQNGIIFAIFCLQFF